MKKIITFVCIAFLSITHAQETITYPSADGLTITANVYITNPLDSPFILLFHQAGWSSGEYLEIAPKLNAMGYNCLAVNQRSGGEINGVVNPTHQLAETKQLGVNYVDALVDLNSSIDFVKQKYAKASKLIIWGSSYSSALVLKIAGTRKDVAAALAFAPGEYFQRLGKSATYITDAAKHITIPVFITSAKQEKDNWWNIYEVIPSKTKQYFLPETTGQHGSRALWEKFPEHQNYWKAVRTFLKHI